MSASNFSSVKLPADLLQLACDAAQPLRRSAARSLGGRRNVGCKLTAAVYFSPISCQISRYSARNRQKLFHRWGQFSLRRLLPPRLLDLAISHTDPMPFNKLCELNRAFEESDLDICVDIIDWTQASSEFQRSVEQSGRVRSQGI